MTREEKITLVYRLSGTDPRKCMKCGKCSGRCPAGTDMDLAPNQFVGLLLKGNFEKMASSRAIWNCLSCMACAERCPRGVSPVSIIEAVRTVVVREQGKNGIKAEEIPPLVDENVPQQLFVSAYRKYNK